MRCQAFHHIRKIVSALLHGTAIECTLSMSSNVSHSNKVDCSFVECPASLSRIPLYSVLYKHFCKQRSRSGCRHFRTLLPTQAADVSCIMSCWANLVVAIQCEAADQLPHEGISKRCRDSKCCKSIAFKNLRLK